MNKPYQINAESLLIITDIHQNLNWVKKILEDERGNYDHVLFNGDWIDSYYQPPVIEGATETAKFVVDAINGRYGPASFNIGNHDAPVMESWRWNIKYSNKPQLFYGCSGYTRSKSLNFNKEMTWENWRKFHVFHTFGGYVISHAGFSQPYWNDYLSTDDYLDRAWTETEAALDLLSAQYSRWFAPGYARGGREVVGGPIWLDWNYEFVDMLPINQIVGHTTMPNTVRKKGKSYCIDGHQTAYAILKKDGELIIKSTEPNKLKIIDETGQQPLS
jgi:hypothetical protein